MPAVVSSFALGASSSTPLIAAQNFASVATIAASALPIRWRRWRTDALARALRALTEGILAGGTARGGSAGSWGPQPIGVGSEILGVIHAPHCGITISAP